MAGTSVSVIPHTYHNCRSSDAHKLSDKYVKGKEYPVVVIEGFPGFMDRFEPGENGQSNEEKMWSFRREVYLCASRATCFLYFVFNPRVETPELVRVKEELNALVSAIAVPDNWETGGTKRWSFFLRETGEKRKLEVFAETTVSEAPPQAVPEGCHRSILEKIATQMAHERRRSPSFQSSRVEGNRGAEFLQSDGLHLVGGSPVSARRSRCRLRGGRRCVGNEFHFHPSFENGFAV